jgi:PTH1 family peptidyl-tRNA hydrolase
VAFGGRGGDRPRRGTPADVLVVGLGNPGSEYDGTRHNVGFAVIDRVALAKPTTFMNLSGESVSPLVRRFGIDEASRLVIVHDELDLPTGIVRVKIGGGLAGHNGLRSIKAHLHDDAFVRVRIGVGKPPSKEDGADHVLKRVGKADRELLDIAIEIAADAVELIVSDGPDAAMNRVNARTA